MKCEDCKHWFDNGTNLSSCDRDALLRERDFFCAAWERKKPFERPDTNADRIRAMSDEELASALYAGCSGRECPEGMWDNPLTEDEEDSLCLKCTIAWLKAPVEEGEG